MRLFAVATFRPACIIALTLNAAFCFGTILADLLICQPVAYRWDRSIPHGRCGVQKSLDLYIAIFNFLLDTAVVIMPMPILWNLRMTIKRKVALSGMFGMGTMYVASP